MKVAIILKAPEFNQTVGEEYVIYADAGYRYKSVVGEKKVLAVVGDFDSLGKAPKDENVVELNVEKNFTDGERAVRLAKEKGATEIVIYGAYGGKIEHVLGNITLLKIAENLGLKAYIKEDSKIMQLFSGEKEFRVKNGANVSLLPFGGDCEFEYSKGLYYPLENLTLTVSDTRGISNVATDDLITLKTVSGECLIVYEV